MELDYDFYQLPLRFDAARLAEEVAAFAAEEWLAPASNLPGNSELPLICLHGNPENQGLVGPQQITPQLERSPYLQQVLATFDSVLGRTRLVRVEPHCDAKANIDASYYWHQRVSVHVPIQTQPELVFHVGDSATHLAAGDCWIFNTWNMHSVKNDTGQARIHLVADMVGSAALWDLVADAQTTPCNSQESAGREQSSRLIPYREELKPQLESELVNFPVVMTPWEQQSLLATILADLRERYGDEHIARRNLVAALLRFQRQWHNAWSRHGQDAAGWPSYENFLHSLRSALKLAAGRLYLANGMEATDLIDKAVIAPALNTSLVAPAPRAAAATVAATPSPESPEPEAQNREATKSRPRSAVDRPVIIVAAPRAGSALLCERLSRAQGVFASGDRAESIFDSMPRLQASNRLFESDRLLNHDADAQTCDSLRRSLLQKAKDRDGKGPQRGRRIRLLDNTAENALRIPFLNALFPDALFIFLYRSPAASISSIVEAWESERFITHRNLPDWTRRDWSFPLTPGWRGLEGHDLFDIALQQWRVVNQHILDDLETIEPERWCAITYDELLADTPGVVDSLCRFAGLPWEDVLGEPLPPSQQALSAPAEEKWRRQEKHILPLLPQAEDIAQRAQAAVLDSRSRPYPERLAVDINKDPERSPLRSSHSLNLSKILESGNFSLIITTYQAGKVVVVRNMDGKLNTHFSAFPKPMGLSVLGPKLAVGTRNAVEFYVEVPRKKGGKEDAGEERGHYFKRLEQVTGNIDIHEMVWSSAELWFINTKFSSLCTLDLYNNFVPRWRPWFISALVPEDRCHLNGLCMVDDKPRYVTALGQSDKAGGWRENRAHGGVIMDVQSNTLIATGLSMPHSPRWYRNQLWVLESGKGALSRVDVATGQIETVVELPGFTRGLTFVGNLAFVGLSEVRETAVFGSIPITESAAERSCGVWVVDIDAAKIVAWLSFKGDIREIFAVEALPGIPSPKIILGNESALDGVFMTPGGTLVAS